MNTISAWTEESILRRMAAVMALLILLGTGGCTYHPNFDGRPSYEAVQQAKRLHTGKKGPIAVEWAPPSFPDRIDEIGPSGKEGAARVMRVPTGVALSERTEELLDAAVGLSPSVGTTLTIEVREARSEYRFAQTFITNRHIDWAQCTVDAGFRLGDLQWEQQFLARITKAETGLQGPELIERVWDEVAIGIAASVVANLPDSPAAVTPAARAPASPAMSARTEETTLAVELEALKRILIRKGLITKVEWDEVLAEIMDEAKQR